MATKIKYFEDLEIWQKATDAAVAIFEISEKGKLGRDYGSRDQIRRAVFSISNNIAEGFEYNNNTEFLRFLKYAKGSCGEVRNQLFILKRVEYLSEDFYMKMYSQLIELSQQIANFMKYLKIFESRKKKK